MLSIVFNVNELVLQSEENIIFAKYAVENVHTIVVENTNKETEHLLEKFNLKKKLAEVENYESMVDFLDIYKDANKDWFLIITNENIQCQKYGAQFRRCSYNFWGSLDQFECKSFTEHAKKKLLYNDLSWLYMDSIANDTQLEVEFLKKLFDQHQINQVLDCCCGVGRHDYELGEAGFKVTGVDISASQIKTAIQTNKNENVRYLVSDIRSLELQKKYDAAICMWTTYNYFSKERDIIEFFNRVSLHLRENGILVLDSKNIPSLNKNRIYQRKTKRGDINLSLLIYKRILGMVQNSQYFYFIDNAGEKEFYIDEEFVRFYTLEELKNLNKDRFRLLHVYGDFEGNVYDAEKSERMITVWEKCKTE